MSRTALLGCLLLSLLCGCYAYVPATLETVPDGARVRALLTPEAERQLLASYGVQQGRTLSGEVLGRDGGQVNLMVASVLMGTGMGNRPLYQQVPVPSHGILRVDVRRLDKFRTGVVLAVAGAGLTAVVIEVVSGRADVVSPPPPPPPQESVRGWGIRIPFSWP